MKVDLRGAELVRQGCRLVRRKTNLARDRLRMGAGQAFGVLKKVERGEK